MLRNDGWCYINAANTHGIIRFLIFSPFLPSFPPCSFLPSSFHSLWLFTTHLLSSSCAPHCALCCRGGVITKLTETPPKCSYNAQTGYAVTSSMLRDPKFNFSQIIELSTKCLHLAVWWMFHLNLAKFVLTDRCLLWFSYVRLPIFLAWILALRPWLFFLSHSKYNLMANLLFRSIIPNSAFVFT